MFLQAEGGPAGLISLLMPFIIMLAVFYFILLRPQQKQQRQRQEMLSQLQKGDQIITVGGIYGEITALHDDIVMLKVAEDVEIKMNRSGVGSVVQ